MGQANLEGLMRTLRPLLPSPLPTLALLLSWLAWSAALAPASAQPAGGSGPPVPVTTEPVRIGPLPLEVLANGVVASESIVSVRPRVDVDVGQHRHGQDAASQLGDRGCSHDRSVPPHPPPASAAIG